MLGRPVAMPILTAPCGANVLAHPDGELAVARATAAAGIVQVLRVGMALRSVADDGHVFAFDQGQVAIFIVKNFHYIS